MSSTTKSRRHQEGQETAPLSPPATDTQISDQTANGQSMEAVVIDTNTIEVADMQVAVPVKFKAGQSLTENEARVIQAAYERQFTNNQNALAKARTEGKNATPQPDATMLADLFLAYEPNVGGAVRQTAMDKMRYDAARRFWTAYVKQHNDSIMSVVDDAGKFAGQPVIVKAGLSIVSTPRAMKAVGKPGEAGHVPEVTKAQAEENWDGLCAALLANANYAPLIQPYIDAIMAERGTAKAPVVPTAQRVVAGADLL